MQLSYDSIRTYSFILLTSQIGGGQRGSAIFCDYLHNCKLKEFSRTNWIQHIGELVIKMILVSQKC